MVRKFLSVSFGMLLLLAFSVPALAAGDAPPGWLLPDYQEEEPEPEPAPEPDLPAEPDPTPPPAVIPTESAGVSHEHETGGADAAASVASGSADRYPVGSYIDPAGQVWSQSGSLLSPEAAQAVAEDPLSGPASALLAGTNGGGPLAVTPEEVTLELLYSALQEMAEEPPGAAYVADLRPAEESPVVLSGLKALVTSIFGEYTPITTTAVVTQTVGSDTYQYLVETVAPGSAGVDYEWLAGVLLFAILLYCFMRLLGGVLK